MTSSEYDVEPADPTGSAGFRASPGETVRVRLDIAYDGTGFSGWAPQPGRRTVCDVLQTTLAMILRETVRLTVAGRTDAGVEGKHVTRWAVVRLCPYVRVGRGVDELHCDAHAIGLPDD